MVRAPTEEPEGVVLRPEVITGEGQDALLERFETLRWEPIVIRGQVARRTARHYGLSYDYESRTPRPGEPTFEMTFFPSRPMVSRTSACAPAARSVPTAIATTVLRIAR